MRELQYKLDTSATRLHSPLQCDPSFCHCHRSKAATPDLPYRNHNSEWPPAWSMHMKPLHETSALLTFRSIDCNIAHFAISSINHHRSSGHEVGLQGLFLLRLART